MGKDRFLAGVSGRAAVKRTLWVLAATAAGSGLLCAAVCLLEAKAAPGQARLYIAGALGCALAGCVVGASLWALACVIESLQDRRRSQERILAALEAMGQQLAGYKAGKGPTSETRLNPGEQGQHVLKQLAELNVNILLSDEQRRAKHEHLVRTTVDRLGGQIDRSLERGDFSAARECVDELARVAADAELVRELSERVAAARREAEAEDLRHGSQRCDDLIAGGDLAQAEQVARGVLERYPGSTPAAELHARILRELDARAEQQRRHQYEEVEKHASARQWRQALTVAQRLLDTFPGTPEAASVYRQLATIRDNARIEEVRQLRDTIRDLIGKRRFAEALTRAEDVVRRFPGTAAAEELSGQLDRLKRRAEEIEQADTI